MFPGRAGSTRMRGCRDPWSQDLSLLILGGTGAPYSADPAFTWASAVPAGNGTSSGPKLTPPSVDRRIRTSPFDPFPIVFVCQAAQTLPLGPTATSDGQVKPSPAADRLPARVVQEAPWLVDRANRTGALVWLKSCQTTYRLLANGLDGVRSAASHSLSRLLVATRTRLPTTAPVVGLIWTAVTFGPAGVPPLR